MFSKASLTFVVLGALYVNAMAVPAAREPAPEPDFSAGATGTSQDPEVRAIPLIPALAAGLTGIAAGAPLISLFRKPKREAELEDQELEARINPLIAPSIAAFAALAPFIPGFPKPKRDLSDELFLREPQGEGDQELEARLNPLIIPGISAIASLAPFLFRKPKRDISDELFSREPQGEGEQDLEARLNPLIVPAINAIAALVPQLFRKPTRDLSDEMFLRDLSDELFSREPQAEGEQDVDARAIPIGAITTALRRLSYVTPLIPSLINKSKRELSEELFSREPQGEGDDVDARAIPIEAITTGLRRLSYITPFIPSLFNKS